MNNALTICRYCDKPITEPSVKVHSYWGAQPYFSHPECRESGFTSEVIECQTIDADCNDCGHFKRGAIVTRTLSCMENGKAAVRVVNMGFFDGHCLKFDLPTVAQPNKWTGHQCFEHRKPAQS